jgi:glutathione peroxidase
LPHKNRQVDVGHVVLHEAVALRRQSGDLFGRGRQVKDKGLVVLGFPSNDFSQEPGNNKEIADFCYNTYGVKFPMFAKSSVKGKDANAMFTGLFKAGAKTPSWNFNKYLIDRDGKLVGSYGSTTRPDEKSFVSALEKALANQ